MTDFEQYSVIRVLFSKKKILDSDQINNKS